MRRFVAVAPLSVVAPEADVAHPASARSGAAQPVTSIRPASTPVVLHIVANLDVGGAQEVVRTLTRHLPETGFRPVVATLRDGPLREPLERSGVPVEIVRGRRHSLVAPHRALGELLRIRGDLARIVARHGAAIVQTHLLRSLDFLVLTLRRESGVRAVLWTVHNSRLDLRPDQLPAHSWLLGPKRLAYRTLYRAGARMADGFVAVADDVGAAVRRDLRPSADRISVIANGVDTVRYPAAVDRAAVRRGLGLPDGARLVLVVGKLMKQKGHTVLLAALPPILAGHPDVHILLAGEGELRAALAGEIEAGALAGRVHLLGNRPDVPELLAASDIFVLPSLWEGLPMALLEAMASGLPVVASRVSGTGQVVRDGDGLLVPPGDPAALGEGIERLLADPEAARGLGAAGRARVEDAYSARAQAHAHATLYRALLARAAHSDTMEA